jgi:serine protease Do
MYMQKLFWIVSLWCLLAAPWVAARPALPDFTEVVEDNLPAVVIISTVQKARHRGTRGYPPGPMPDYFRYFFGDGFEMPEPQRESLGSGILLSKDGYILTNYHVVQGADEISIRLSDRRVLDAELKGGDELSDLALLKVEAENLPVVKLGRSAHLKVGEWVLAIGSPFGFEHSVTSGIVSAVNRNLSNDNYVPFIQTDVAINPGNSGGPLFNLEGEVVGINSQIYSRTGGFMGLSFAIPIDVAMDVVEQIKKNGQVSRGWLGVIIQDINRDLALSLGLKKPSGALVSRVLPEGPAGRAGLRPGDVILELDGTQVSTAASLRNLVGRTKPGSEVPVKISRAGELQTIEIEIGELPVDSDQPRSAPAQSQAQSTKLGMNVTPLAGDRATQLGIEGGVMVTDVPGKQAREAGIRPGDVVVNLANQDIRSVEDYRKVERNLKSGSWVPILINREGAPEFLALKVE